jgi:hypothetical protein
MRVHHLLPAFAITLLTQQTQFVVAWGAAGHEIVATIAQIHLHPSVFPSLCELLGYTPPDEPAPGADETCHLAPVATWADRVRFKMRWSAGLHYIGALDDFPSSQCVFPGERGWADKENHNILGGIKNVTGILEEWVDGGEEDGRANEALKFLVHFVGDLHQPLHLTGRARGGNGVPVLFDNRSTSKSYLLPSLLLPIHESPDLHTLWDSGLIAKQIRTVPPKYNQPLPSPQIEGALRGTIYDAYVRRIMWEGVLGRWRDTTDEWMTCPAVPSTTPTPEMEIEMESSWTQTVIDYFGLGALMMGSEGGAAEWDTATVCPYAWATKLHDLNCELVWPSALDEPSPSSSLFAPGLPLLELDTPEYSGVIAKEMVLERLLAMGGLRLAGILNGIFADEEAVRRSRLIV